MMLFLNQPFDGYLGNILIEKLEESYNGFTIFSAFAKNSGVLRVKDALLEFKDRGGKVEAFIGVDAHGTSYEAVLNLFEICDELYIIHSENSSQTFHSKIYALSNNEQLEWIAIGSNNLTGGGLWSNFESAVCLDNAGGYEEIMDSYNSLLHQYKNPSNDCSLRVTSIGEIDELCDEDYLRTEERIRQNSFQTDRRQQNPPTNGRLFGRYNGIHIPPNEAMTRQPREITDIPRERTRTVHDLPPVEEENNSERMWVETGSLTGGSRNILDLSKTGRIQRGDATGTRYEIDDDHFILGSVAFFDINPDDTTHQKDVTINYDGVDYSPCTIKFADNNGSWRIQLKGQSESGIKLYLLNESDWLCQKILIFEKIYTDYYSLSVLSETERNVLMDQSIVVAHNGSSRRSRLYGIL